MPVRVLHIVANMNRGGLENFLMNVYRTLDREQIQFDFLVTREVVGAFDEEIRLLGGKVYNIPAMTQVGYWKYKKSVYQFFKEHPEYQIVHCHRDALGGIYLKQAYKAQIPTRVAHSHTSKIGEPKSIKGILRSVIKAGLKPLLNKYSTHHFACGTNAGEWLFGKSIPVQVINNGIELNKYRYTIQTKRQVREELGVDEKTLLIGHVGRFCYPKNHTFLIDIVSQLVQVIPNCKLCLVGEGELEVSIRSKVQTLGLENKVLFLGVREDVPRILNAFDLFVFPSLLEGIPVTLIEAQASGLQCLVSNQITSEADLGIHLTQYLPIDTVVPWIETIKGLTQKMDNMRATRYTNDLQIRLRGYDILQTTKYLENFYIEQYKQNRGDANESNTHCVYANIQ